MNVEAYSIIVPVWGPTHVARFLDWVIPSWLSPSNIPHLAASAPVEVILLTSRADHARIARHPVTDALGAHARLRFVEIDDLMPGGIPTVTLTLAFLRGVKTAMAQDPRPNIVFLNADFLLSDGSLASIARRFGAGQQVLLCSSIRVVETRVMPELDRIRHPNGSMTVPAREAVRLAFGALHPTVVACRIDQPLLQSAHPNQFFWQVDPTTLLLRAFLLFPLAVKPTKLPEPVNNYCDYGWIGTLAPNAPVDVIQMTDEFFAIELAPEDQEVSFVHPGPIELDDIAHRISVWANDFSRAQPLTPLIFNSAEISKDAIDQATATSAIFISDLFERLGPPQPASNHPYWLGGATAYLNNRRKIGISAHPSEMAELPAVSNQDFALVSRIRSFGVRLLLGTAGARRLWHPYRTAERMIAGIGPCRVVGPERIATKLNVAKSPTGTPLGAVDPRDSEALADVIGKLAEAVAPGGQAHLILGFGTREFSELLGVKERIAALGALDPFFRILSAYQLVSAFEAAVVMRHRRLADQLHLVPMKRRLWLIASSTMALVKMTAANLRPSQKALSMDDQGVNCLLLELRRHAIS